MSDASYALQAALVPALKGAAPISALVGAGVYDSVSANALMPRITIGNVQVLPDRAQDYEGNDVVFTLDTWSQKPGFGEVKAIGAALSAYMENAALVISGFRLIEIAPEQTTYVRDPDGLTSHGIHVFRARTEPSA